MEDGLRSELRAWTVRREPDGTLRMRRAARPARGGAVLRWVGLLVCVLSGAAAVGSWQGAGSHPLVFPRLLFLLGAALTVRGLWVTFVWEEWRVGLDLLEVRRGLFGVRRVSRYRGAALKLVHSTSVGYSRRLLDAQTRVSGAALPADFKPGWLRLYVVEGRRGRCLRAVDDPRREALHALGEFLGEHTGWPLILVRGEGGSRRERRARR